MTMKRRVLSAALLLSVALPLFAQDAPPAAPAPVATQADATAAGDDAKVDRFCLRETGTHIRKRATKPGSRAGCPSLQSGRVYTQDDLRMTGEIDIADALRRLDPAIR
jgi:hypothetical protein